MTRMTAVETLLLKQANEVVRRQMYAEYSNRLLQPKQIMSLEQTLFLAAFDLIKDEDNWCQGSLMQTVQKMKMRLEAVPDKLIDLNDPVNYRIKNSVKFVSINQYCSVGAIRFAGRMMSKDTEERVLMALARTLRLRGYSSNIATFNDNHSHREVIAMWEATGQREGWL